MFGFTIEIKLIIGLGFVVSWLVELNMLAVQSNIAKCLCLFIQVAVAFQTLGLSDSHGRAKYFER